MRPISRLSRMDDDPRNAIVNTVGPPLAPWLLRAGQELRRYHHLIVHGNVDDLVLWDHRYQGLREVLAAFLARHGFPIVGLFNPIDGLAYRDTVEPPAQALTAVRRLMLQAQHACAIVVESADLLVGPIGRLDPSYAATMAQLRRILADAAIVGDPPLRNSLVFVSRDLDDVPVWLRDNPNIAVVAARRPGLDERIGLLRSRVERFYRPLWMTSEAAQLAADPLAQLSEGMTVRDLQSLEVTSVIAEIGPDAPRELIARHRFGHLDDPWERLDLGTVRAAEDLLNERVRGQPAAVRAVADALVSARIGVDFGADGELSQRPKCVLFLVGPTGVGKTELAHALAELVFDDPTALRCFDLSDFDHGDAIDRLTGPPPGYPGYEHGGALTNWVLERPFSVIVFDDLDKASPALFDIFLQMIDEGRLTDGRGRTAYFSHSIIILTSSLGAASVNAAHPESTPSYELLQRHFSRAVAQFFTGQLRRSELVGRLGGGIVVFDILRPPAIAAITERYLRQLTESARARGFDLELDRDAILQAVVDYVTSTGATLGARPIRDSLLEQWIRVPLNRFILAQSPPPGTRLWVRRTGAHPPFTVEVHPTAAEPAPAGLGL